MSQSTLDILRPIEANWTDNSNISTANQKGNHLSIGHFNHKSPSGFLVRSELENHPFSNSVDHVHHLEMASFPCMFHGYVKYFQDAYFPMKNIYWWCLRAQAGRVTTWASGLIWTSDDIGNVRFTLCRSGHLRMVEICWNRAWKIWFRGWFVRQWVYHMNWNIFI